MIAIIIFSAVGLAVCLCYLIYQLISLKKNKQKPAKPQPVQTQRYEYCDEYEEGDSLIINLKNY